MGLLTLVQQQSIKPISNNWAVTVKNTGGLSNFLQVESEVEENELRDLLGVALLQDIQDNPTDANNVLLLDGSTFEDCNGNTVKTKGLRYVIAYMVHSQEVFESKIADTFSGYVNKNRQETTDLNQGQTKTLQARSRELALTEFELIRQYLDENSTTYPLWICGISKKPYTPKIIGVKKTYR